MAATRSGRETTNIGGLCGLVACQQLRTLGQACAMKDKTKELAVFTIGLGIIGALLMVCVILVGSQSVVQEGHVFRMVVMFLPAMMFISAGAFVLALPSKMTIAIAVAVITVALVVQAILSFNPINWIISFGIAYLVWKTARQATSQIDHRRYSAGPPIEPADLEERWSQP
jgi:hypothetical protein